MKLIVEEFENLEASISESTQGKRDVFIEGIFAQAVVKNRNGRIYPKPILENRVASYIRDFVNKNRAMGELNHRQSLDLDPERVCHKITHLEWDESNVYGKSKLTNTPLGNLVRNLVIDDGISLGVSTRGAGSVKTMNEGDVIQNDYFLKCWDVVCDPSASEAYVNAVMEQKEWLFIDGVLTECDIKKVQENIDKISKPVTFNPKALDKLFKNIIQNL